MSPAPPALTPVNPSEARPDYSADLRPSQLQRINMWLYLLCGGLLVPSLLGLDGFAFFVAPILLYTVALAGTSRLMRPSYRAPHAFGPACALVTVHATMGCIGAAGLTTLSPYTLAGWYGMRYGPVLAILCLLLTRRSHAMGLVLVLGIVYLEVLVR